MDNRSSKDIYLEVIPIYKGVQRKKAPIFMSAFLDFAIVNPNELNLSVLGRKMELD